MGNSVILNEIMLNAKEVPLECQERVLDILKGMVFTKKCLLNKTPRVKEKSLYEKGVNCLLQKEGKVIESEKYKITG